MDNSTQQYERDTPDELDYDFSEIQEDIKDVIKISELIPSKSLEISGLDLCGYSQDDVWEEAITWYKNQLNDALNVKEKE